MVSHELSFLLYLVMVSSAFGLAYGRLPCTVSARVFSEDHPTLLRASDAWPSVGDPGENSARIVSVQFLMGALFGVMAAAVGPRWVVVAYLWFTAVTVTLTLTDLERKIIPNRVLVPSFGIAAILLSVGAYLDDEMAALSRASLGAFAYFAVFLIIASVMRGSLGMGDVKLVVLLGAFLSFNSWEAFIVGVLGAFLLGGVVSIIALIAKIKSRKDEIAFAPYLVTSSYVAIIAGIEIADWYNG